jgi:hypothetical protein
VSREVAPAMAWLIVRKTSTLRRSAGTKVEAGSGIEPLYEDLQSSA